MSPGECFGGNPNQLRIQRLQADDELEVIAYVRLRSPDLDLQVHTGVATREVAHATGFAVVESSLHPPTRPAGRFFPRRRSRKIRALGSPKPGTGRPG